MRNNLMPKNLSKKEKKEFAKAHRKPAIPPTRIADSKSERDRKNRRKEKQDLRSQY